MRYNPVPCTEEQLLPTRWIVKLPLPSRQQVADHLWQLRQRWGSETARECRRRMIWVGIFPVACMKRNGGQSYYGGVHESGT